MRRILEAVRRRIAGPRVHALDCAINASARKLSFVFTPAVGFAELVTPVPTIHSEGLRCSMRAVDTILDPKVEVETPPSEIEAEVVSADTAMAAAEVKSARVKVETGEAGDVDPDFTRGINSRAVAVEELKAKLYALKLASQIRVRDGWRVASTQSLKRKSIRVYRLPAEERVAYWRELVSQVSRHPKELELIGIFPGVPEQGIRRVALRSGSDVLSLWLDWSKARGARAGTMIIAKERATGKLFRVFDRRK